MYWWLIIQSLKEFLEQQPELTGVTIIEGGTDEHIYPRLEILWDDEGGIQPHTKNKGNITFWIDQWVENTAPDQASAYGLLYPLQQAFFSCIDEWTNYVLEKLDLSINVTVTRVVSDGGISRPIAGSRAILEIEWRR